MEVEERNIFCVLKILNIYYLTMECINNSYLIIKTIKMNRLKLKRLLMEATWCGLQHDWRPCWACFFTMSEELTIQDRQALLLFRWDYTRDILDNLPEDIDKSIEKIKKIAENF